MKKEMAVCTRAREGYSLRAQGANVLGYLRNAIHTDLDKTLAGIINLANTEHFAVVAMEPADVARYVNIEDVAVLQSAVFGNAVAHHFVE